MSAKQSLQWVGWAMLTTGSICAFATSLEILELGLGKDSMRRLQGWGALGLSGAVLLWASK